MTVRRYQCGLELVLDALDLSQHSVLLCSEVGDTARQLLR